MIGSKITHLSNSDIVHYKSTYVLVKNKGQTDGWCVYKATEYGYFELKFSGTLTQCSIYMDNI